MLPRTGEASPPRASKKTVHQAQLLLSSSVQTSTLTSTETLRPTARLRTSSFSSPMPMSCSMWSGTPSPTLLPIKSTNPILAPSICRLRLSSKPTLILRPPPKWSKMLPTRRLSMMPMMRKKLKPSRKKKMIKPQPKPKPLRTVLPP